MKTKIYFVLLYLFMINIGHAQPQLKYDGKNEQLIEAIIIANRILLSPEFYTEIEKINKFNDTKDTSYNGQKISNEFKSLKNTITVKTIWRPFSARNAFTQTKIKINRLNLDRSLSSIVNTLIHETVHFVDFQINEEFEYTHLSQYAENPSVSAPYIIGEIAQKIVTKHLSKI